METIDLSYIIVERVRVSPDAYGNTTQFNTNNHPREPDDAEANALDYVEEHRKTNLMRYAHLVGYPVVWEYKIPAEDITILRECADKGRHLTSALLFKDELEPVIEHLRAAWQNGMWFFRFNSCSPKDGAEPYPVYSPEQVARMIATSKRGWGALCDGDDTLYFVKHNANWDTRREFRVFVRKGRVTAVSQYNPYTGGIMSGQSTQKIRESIHQIVTWLHDDILPRVLPAIGTNNVTADIYLGDSGPRIVEFNTFGYWQAAGSALFHWLNDKKKLYNESGKVWVRIVK